jgi:hypothetical protein
MSRLGLELFISAEQDFEVRQYQILNALATVRSDFSHNRIYPTLGELIDLYTTLSRISKSAGDIRHELPRRITGLDLKAQRIIYESLNLSPRDVEAVEELINWSLPHIQRTIEEGQTIFNFVDESLDLEEVGIVPSYTEEGYLMIPEPRRRLLHVLRYEVSIFTGSEQRYRNLKTISLQSIPLGLVEQSPMTIKRQLIEAHRDMPNPATYLFRTELDFPYTETILPVAKRKFMRRLYS